MRFTIFSNCGVANRRRTFDACAVDICAATLTNKVRRFLQCVFSNAVGGSFLCRKGSTLQSSVFLAKICLFKILRLRFDTSLFAAVFGVKPLFQNVSNRDGFSASTKADVSLQLFCPCLLLQLTLFHPNFNGVAVAALYVHDFSDNALFHQCKQLIEVHITQHVAAVEFWHLGTACYQ